MAIHVGVTAVIIMLIMPIIYCSLAILGTSIRGPRGGPSGAYTYCKHSRFSGTFQCNTEEKKCVDVYYTLN